jgi:hypothetical protein
MFIDKLLKGKGWTEIAPMGEYAKGSWRILFDTSSWMIVSTTSNPRVFDVHVPGDYESSWTVNLIEHLCNMEDERHRLRTAMKGICDNPKSGQEAHSTLAEALARCYHSWLVDIDVPEGRMGRLYCPICGRTATQIDSLEDSQ